MTNNDIIRSIRYSFGLSNPEIIRIFALGGLSVTQEEAAVWFKKEEDPEFKPLNDLRLATFLNGLITWKRGKKEGEQPVPEKKLNNNIILRKLKIALDLRDEEILEILGRSGRRISKHELSAFFRKPGQSQYRPCKDQILRNFLHGLKM